MKSESKVVKNIIYAFAAQGVSLLLSLLSAFVIPKFLDRTNYGYWSLFTFYSGYTSIFNLGINDGVYLKIGGVEYNKMDRNLIGSQFRFSIFFQSAIGIVLSVAVLIFSKDGEMTFELLMTLLYMLVYNLTMYFGMVFQATNETRWFSMSVIIDKIAFIGALLFLFISGEKYYRSFVWLYMICKMIGLAYCAYMGRAIIFSKNVPLPVMVKESLDSIKVGINLTIGTIAGNLILGIGRQMVEWKWDVERFAVLTFAFTLTNFFLLFISQISMVLFPALRQIDESRQRHMYDTMRNWLLVVLPLVFLIYIPANAVLKIWLPDYAESLKYMALLLPICIFDGKMNLLCATFFKVLRKERFILGVNLFAMGFSVILSFIGAYIVGSMKLVVIFMVISIGARYFVSEYYLEKLFDGREGVRRFWFKSVQEIALSVIGVLACWYTSTLTSLIIVVIAYSVYLLLNKSSVVYVYDLIKNKLLKK